MGIFLMFIDTSNEFSGFDLSYFVVFILVVVFLLWGGVL